MQVIARHGVAGLRTHRLCPEAPAHELPWDELRVLEESWSGMRPEIEQMLLVSEQLPVKAPRARATHGLQQLKQMVRFSVLLYSLPERRARQLCPQSSCTDSS